MSTASSLLQEEMKGPQNSQRIWPVRFREASSCNARAQRQVLILETQIVFGENIILLVLDEETESIK